MRSENYFLCYFGSGHQAIENIRDKLYAMDMMKSSSYCPANNKEKANLFSFTKDPMAEAAVA